MGSTGSGGSIIAGYAVVKAHEPALSESVDARAGHASLDKQELQELEGELYGAGAGPVHEPDPVATSAIHVPHPHLPHRGG
jgi:hypothetical protein